LIISKAGFSALTIVGTLAFLFHLTQWTQKNEQYVANRTLKLADLDKLEIEATRPAQPHNAELIRFDQGQNPLTSFPKMTASSSGGRQ
jgi:hypothetical protein